MATRINQRELRNESGAVMRRVEGGESFIVTRNGTPVADLVPHRSGEADSRQRFVPVDVIARGLASLPDWGVEQFASELRELDSALDDEHDDPWSRR